MDLEERKKIVDYLKINYDFMTIDDEYELSDDEHFCVKILNKTFEFKELEREFKSYGYNLIHNNTIVCFSK
jgi:hypothetical protein